MLRDRRNDRFRLGQQRAAARYAHERTILLRVAHLIFSVERRHPDDAAPSAGDLGEVFDRRGVHAADREIQIDAAEHFQTRRLFAREVREPRGRIVVILQNEAAHAFRARQLRDVDAVDGPRHVVGIGVNVDVDRSAEQLRGVAPGALRTGARRGASQRGQQRQHDGDEGDATAGAHATSQIRSGIVIAIVKSAILNNQRTRRRPGLS